MALRTQIEIQALQAFVSEVHYQRTHPIKIYAYKRDLTVLFLFEMKMKRLYRNKFTYLCFTFINKIFEVIVIFTQP